MRFQTNNVRFGCVLAVVILTVGGTHLDAENPPALDPNSVPLLLKNLAGDDVPAAAAAARSLGVIFAPGGKGAAADAEPVTQALLAQLATTRGAAIRREVATALGSIEAKAASAPLTERMSDSEVTVAIAAGLALGKILPADEARKLFIEKAVLKSENLAAASVAGLAPLAKAEDAKLLSDALELKNWRLQMHAVKGLEKAVLAGARLDAAAYDRVAIVLGAETAEAAETAIHFFTHVRNEECLRAAIAAADARGDGSRDDTSWRTRTMALRTIRHLDWPATKEALPVFVRNLGDPTANVINEVRGFLNHLQKEHLFSREELVPILVGELEKAGPLPRRAALMNEIGDQLPQEFASAVSKAAAQTLEESLKAADAWSARAAALKMLGLAGYTGAMETVARCVGDDTSNVRFAAGQTLERLAPLATAEQKVKVAAILLPFLQKTVDWHKTAVAAHAAGDFAQKETLQPLVDLLGHNVINVKEGAANSLCKIARGDNAEFRATLEKAIQAEFTEGEKCWEFGSKVVGALRDPQGLKLLVPVLGSSNWRAQAHAAAAVAEIAAHAKSKIDDKALSDALIRAAQSEILQVQEEANKALRTLARGE